MFSDPILREIDETVDRYPDPTSALLPLLHIVQRERGWISAEAEVWVAERLDLTPANVHGVLTFYSMYYTQPMGRYVIQLCRTLSCELRGCQGLRRHLEKRLGIGVGETSADGRFSLIEVECIGACGTAPAIMINEDLYENLSVEGIDAILDALPAHAEKGSAGDAGAGAAPREDGEHGGL